jgi:hypothetical protein
MNIRNPIYSFSLIVFLFGIFIFLIMGFWGIGAILWLFGIYSILLLTSFLLKKFKVKYRQIIEWSLIFVYVLSHTLYHLNWDVGSEIYFTNENEPFVGKNQSFIIVFGIENQPKIESNYFTNNKILIPENGILLTSSKKEIFKHRYRFPVVGSGEKFSATYFEQYNCYGEKNYKFNYVVGTISDLGEVDYRYRDSIGDLICEKLKNEDFKNNLKVGYENGNYLDQKGVLINYQNLTKLPNGLLELRNLEYLNVHSNKLKVFPKSILEFPKLKRLTIGYNEIKTIPEWIGGIKNLESLAVNGNDLTSIPDTLLTLPKLNYLLIRENDFDESEIKETIEKFEQKGVTVQYE